VAHKVVLTDTTAADYVVEREVFEGSGLDLSVIYLQTRDPAVFLDHVGDADAVVLSWAPFTRTVIDRLARCRIIARFGIGVDMIDLDAATEKGILVCNTARYCIDEVSTQAIAFLLALNRQIEPMNAEIRRGGWSPAALNRPAPRRLRGQRLGLVGLGNIGRAVAAKARGIGLDVVAYDPYLAAGGSAGDAIELLSLADLLATSDYVSIHCPLNAATRHLIGAPELARMKPEAFLINCARGAIVDQSALEAALAARQIAGAGLDVFETEPLPADSRLRHLDNVILTPHTAHWSAESAVECRETAVEHVVTYFRGQVPSDVVNRAVLTVGRRS
jgi:D-3-phosphoglycerate dehydrogenase